LRFTVPIAALSAFLCAGAQPQGFASVSGMVVDYSSSVPLPGVHVRLTGEFETRGAVVYGVVSDERGIFLFPRVPPGNYMVRPNESARSFFVDVLKSGTRRTSDLTLKAGDSIEGILLRVARAGSITGRVIGDDGEPIEGARVSAETADGPSQLLPHGGWDYTDDHGIYRLLCSPGKYRVSVEPATTLTAAYANFLRADGEDFDYGRTVGDAVVEVQPDRETSNDEIRLVHRLVPTPKSNPLDNASLEGTVVDVRDGTPLSHARVTIHPGVTEGEAKGFGPSEMLRIGRMRTYYADAKSDGKFAMRGLAPGRYLASVYRTGFLGGNMFGMAVCELRSGEKATVTLKLSPAAAITGRVVDEDGNPPPRVNVDATGDLQGDPEKRFFDGYFGGSLTDENGTFRIHGLASGRFRVKAAYYSRDGHGIPPETPGAEADKVYAPTFYPSVTAEESSTWLQVPAGGEVNGVVIRLVRAPMLHLSGHVTSSRGAPPPTRVEILVDGGVVGEVQVPAGGTFTFWRVLPGHYQVVAYTEGAPWERLTASVEVEIIDHSLEGVELSIVPAPKDVGGANH